MTPAARTVAVWALALTLSAAFWAALALCYVAGQR